MTGMGAQTRLSISGDDIRVALLYAGLDSHGDNCTHNSNAAVSLISLGAGLTG